MKNNKLNLKGHYDYNYENIVQSKLYMVNPIDLNSKWILEWIDHCGNENAKMFNTNAEACEFYHNLKYGDLKINSPTKIKEGLGKND